MVPQGILQISSDGDDRMGAKIKTQKLPSARFESGKKEATNLQMAA